MELDQTLTSALLNATSQPGPGDGEGEEVNSKLRKDWNDYVAYLEKKKLKGDPVLDTDQRGFKELEEYRKINPSTSLSKDNVVAIQEELKKYRDWSLGQIKLSKAAFAPGTTEENYMSALSKVDGYPGSRTTSYTFPTTYLKLKDAQGKVIKVEDKGFTQAAGSVQAQVYGQ